MEHPGRGDSSWPPSTAARGLTRDAFDNRFTRLAVLSARQKAGELDESMHVVR